MKLLRLMCLVACLPFLAETSFAAGEPRIDEWEVPYPSSRPRDPYVDPAGRVWFCGQAGGYLAYFEPESASFTKVELEDGAGPHNLIVDNAGMVWFAANTLPYIGRLDPQSGEITRYQMPDPAARDPHTLAFDGDGHIWFTVQWGNFVGRLDMASGEVRLIGVPEPRARPYGIKVGADGRPWVALLGANLLATVDPESFELETVELPRPDARPRRLEIDDDGSIWYVDYAKGRLGRFHPSNSAFEEWPMPGGEKSSPYGTALDDGGTLWIAEGGAPNRLVSFDTAAETFTSVTDIPNARGAVRHMYFHPSSGEIWFGEDTNYLARVRTP